MRKNESELNELIQLFSLSIQTTHVMKILLIAMIAITAKAGTNSSSILDLEGNALFVFEQEEDARGKQREEIMKRLMCALAEEAEAEAGAGRVFERDEEDDDDSWRASIEAMTEEEILMGALLIYATGGVSSKEFEAFLECEGYDEWAEVIGMEDQGEFNPTDTQRDIYAIISRAHASTNLMKCGQVLRDVREYVWMTEKQKADFPEKVKEELRLLNEAMEEGYFTWHCVGQNGVMILT